MKKILTLFAALVLLAVGATAQKLSYSAVVRNSANELVVNKTLTVEISITNGVPSATVAPVYSETQTATTNQNGLLSLTIGDNPTHTGDLSNVTWPTAYITTTYTIDGSTVTNTVAVNAVPYALYAENAGNSTPVQSDWNVTDDADPAYIWNKPTIPTYTLTAGDIINVINNMTAEEKEQMCAALAALGCSGGGGGGETPTTETCPTISVPSVTAGENNYILTATITLNGVAMDKISNVYFDIVDGANSGNNTRQWAATITPNGDGTATATANFPKQGENLTDMGTVEYNFYASTSLIMKSYCTVANNCGVVASEEYTYTTEVAPSTECPTFLSGETELEVSDSKYIALISYSGGSGNETVSGSYTVANDETQLVLGQTLFIDPTTTQVRVEIAQSAVSLTAGDQLFVEVTLTDGTCTQSTATGVYTEPAEDQDCPQWDNVTATSFLVLNNNTVQLKLYGHNFTGVTQEAFVVMLNETTEQTFTSMEIGDAGDYIILTGSQIVGVDYADATYRITYTPSLNCEQSSGFEETGSFAICPYFVEATSITAASAYEFVVSTPYAKSGDFIIENGGYKVYTTPNLGTPVATVQMTPATQIVVTVDNNELSAIVDLTDFFTPEALALLDGQTLYIQPFLMTMECGTVTGDTMQYIVQDPTTDCPTLGATTITPASNATFTTYLEIETVINDYDENLVDPATAKFEITYTTESQTYTTTVDNANSGNSIMVDDGLMRYYFPEQQVVISMTVTPSIALAGDCATLAMITGEPGTYPLACPSFVEQSTTVTPDPNAPTVMVVQAQIQNYAGEENVSVENSGVKIKVNNSTIATIKAANNVQGNPIPNVDIAANGLMTAKIDCANYGTTFTVVPFLDSYCIDDVVDYTYTNHVDVEGTPVEVTMTTPMTPGFTVTDASVSTTKGLTCNLKLIDPGMEPAALTDVTLKVGSTTFTPAVQQVPMKAISEMYELTVPYSDIVNANIDLSGNVLEDVEVDFKYGDQTYSAATNNAVEADFVICSTLGATTVATTPATGDVVTFVATVDNSNANITGKFFTITYMVGTTEQTLTLENTAVEINTDGNLVGHITETAATPLYGKTLTVVPTITLNAPCENSVGESLVYNMPASSAPTGFNCGTDNLTVGGNTYQTVLIGSQCWTKTNMREVAGNNGTTSGETSKSQPYYYVMNGEYFYNWPAAKQVCPAGWYLPSSEEWTALTDYVQANYSYEDCQNSTAKVLASETGWNSVSTGACFPGIQTSFANNATGFSALPAGSYGNSNIVSGKQAAFWTSTEPQVNGSNAQYRRLSYNNSGVTSGAEVKSTGFSVRCLRDANYSGGETVQTECPTLGNPTFCKEVGTNKVTITIKTPIDHYNASMISEIVYNCDFQIPGGGSVGAGIQSMATNNDVTNIDGNYVCIQEVELDAATWQSNQSLIMDYSRTIEYSSNCDGSSNVTDNGSITVYEMPACVSGTCPSLGETGAPTENEGVVTVITPINDYDANKIGLYSYRIYYTDNNFFVKSAGDGASISAAGFTTSFNPATEIPGSYATAVCTLRIVPVLNVICSDDVLVGTEVEYVYVPAPEPFVCGTSTVKDHQNHAYHTVKIGNQCWMAENMRATTSPSTGTDIMNYTSNEYTCTGKMAKWYNNSQAAAISAGYGLLYNWNAAVDTFNTQFSEKSMDTNYNNCVHVTFTGYRRGICPENWHIPTDAEWDELTNYIRLNYPCADSTEFIAKALASTTGWDSYSGDCYPGDQTHNANNDSGFGAVPAGYFNNVFYGAGEQTNFWSTTQMGNMQAYFRHLYKGGRGVTTTYSMKFYGYSVRCIKDND